MSRKEKLLSKQQLGVRRSLRSCGLGASFWPVKVCESSYCAKAGVCPWQAGLMGICLPSHPGILEWSISYLGCSHRLYSLGVFTWPLYSRNWNEFRLNLSLKNCGLEFWLSGGRGHCWSWPVCHFSFPSCERLQSLPAPSPHSSWGFVPASIRSIQILLQIPSHEISVNLTALTLRCEFFRAASSPGCPEELI